VRHMGASGLGSPPNTYSVQGQKVRAAFWDVQARAQYRLCLELLLRIHIPNTIVQNSSTAFWILLLVRSGCQ